MKNGIKLFGIIALIAIIGISMAACGDNDGANLAGTNWGRTNMSSLNGAPLEQITWTLTFSDATRWQEIGRKANGDLFMILGDGTYTFNTNDKTGVMIQTNSTSTMTFKVVDNKLILNGDGWDREYTKK